MVDSVPLDEKHQKHESQTFRAFAIITICQKIETLVTKVNRN